jgi:hypothetical protein
MFDFKEATEMALRTWYPKDHDLHFNPHHPLGKLLGEWGELLDDYMKSIYKPGCEFKPLDELGDIWYYLRILCYQENVKPYYTDMLIIPELDVTVVFSRDDIDTLIGAMMYCTSQKSLYLAFEKKSSHRLFLSTTFSIIFEIAKRYHITLQQLTDSNWEKLKPGSVRGDQWMQARENTEYVGGKVAKK